jgi:hypothetical protein
MDLGIGRAVPTVSTSEDTILRGLGAVLLLGVAQIHFVDIFDKFRENTAQGLMFTALIVGCCLAVAALIYRPNTGIWLLAGLCGVAPLFFYVISRTVGLAGANDDIGNWTEPLGLASLGTESTLALVALAALAVSRLLRVSHQPAPSDANRR